MRFVILIAIVLVSTFLISCSPDGGEPITVTNPSDMERPDELVVISRGRIEKTLGKIPSGKYATLGLAGHPVVIQYDDMDKDGNWDELAFLYSFKPKEKIECVFIVSDATAAIKAVVRAHARHRRKNSDNTFGPDLVTDSIPAGQPATDFTKQAYPPFLTEGPSWENDKVGFRLYFDVRNGKDIWGKTTTAMVLDAVGTDTANNYHLPADWGMDILKVGKSLGAGALALQVPLPAGGDTLVRLGGVSMGKVVYEKIADGPVRAIIRVSYPAWKVLNDLPPVSLVEEISIWGGQYFYESKVTVKNEPAGVKLVTGIVNLYSRQSYRVDTLGSKILYSYDLQTENKDNLGMAIVTDSKNFIAFGNAPDSLADVQRTYTVSQKISSGQPVIFRFYAGWEKTNSSFSNLQGFEQFLRNEAVSANLEVEVN